MGLSAVSLGNQQVVMEALGRLEPEEQQAFKRFVFEEARLRGRLFQNQPPGTLSDAGLLAALYRDLKGGPYFGYSRPLLDVASHPHDMRQRLIELVGRIAGGRIPCVTAEMKTSFFQCLPFGDYNLSPDGGSAKVRLVTDIPREHFLDITHTLTAMAQLLGALYLQPEAQESPNGDAAIGGKLRELLRADGYLGVPILKALLQKLLPVADHTTVVLTRMHLPIVDGTTVDIPPFFGLMSKVQEIENAPIHVQGDVLDTRALIKALMRLPRQHLLDAVYDRNGGY